MTILKSSSVGPPYCEKTYGLIPFVPNIRTKISKIGGKGRGVVTLDSISPAGLIMCDAVDRYSGQEAKALRDRELYYHLFVDPDHYRKHRQIDLLWAIGPISIINHSNSPNCEVLWRKSSDFEWVVLQSLRAIEPYEELTIFYTNIVEYVDYEAFA